MAGRTQLKVLTQVDPEGNDYTVRFVFGEIRRGTRQLIDESGARLPIGGTTFIVNRGAVLLSEVMSIRGQNFKVVGVEPLAPWFRKDRLTTDIETGRPVELGLHDAWAIDGDRFTIDGDLAVVR